MNTDRIAKALFLTVTMTAACALLVGFGMHSAYNKTAPFRVVNRAVRSMTGTLDTVSETSILRPDHLIQPARYKGEGVTVNRMPANGEMVLLSGFFGEDHELRLIQRDGTVVNRLPLVFSDIFADASFLSTPPATKWNVDTHGALARPDGSVVFNFDYSGTAALDRCGRPLWTLGRQSHHSIEPSERGGFWIPGSRVIPKGQPSPFPPFETPFVETTVMHVSAQGEVLREIPIERLFYDNGLEAVLTSAAAIFHQRGFNAWNREIVHLNKVTELSAALAPDFPMFAAGDLLLSFRNKNLLMVFDPDSGKVKWWRIGPWLRQHDAEFRAGGTIMMFNNNIYLEALPAADRTTKRTPLETPRVSNILAVNPLTGETSVLYGGEAGEEMLSVTRGKVDATPGGGLIVTEFDGGRVFEVDAGGRLAWEFINRYDDDEVSEITEARVYPAGYFTVTDWSCAAQPQPAAGR